MNIEMIARKTRETIPTDLIPDYEIDYEFGNLLYDEELILDPPYGDSYLNGRVRVALLQSEYAYYFGERREDDSAYAFYFYAYDPERGYTAVNFDGEMKEIEEAGGIEPFLCKILCEDPQVLYKRGECAFTGEMEE